MPIPLHPETNFFGDTGLQEAISSDGLTNLATAFGRNKRVGKVYEAEVIGQGDAIVQLRWNGDVKFEDKFPGPGPGPDSIATANGDRPAAEDVISATVTFTYLIEDNEVKAGASGSGSVEVDFSWNGETTFSGSSAFDENTDNGAPSFFGDLSAFDSSFSNSDFSIEADDLDISQEVTLTLTEEDILSYFGSGPGISRFDTGEFTMNFAGSATATASGSGGNGNGGNGNGNGNGHVPEPETFFLFAIGLVGLGLSRWWARKPRTVLN